MRLEAVECSHYAALKAFAPLMPSSSSSSITLLKSRNFYDKVSRIRRSPASNSDEKPVENEPSFRVRGSAKTPDEEGGFGGKNKGGFGKKKKLHYCATSRESPPQARRDSFLEARLDFLEPMMLGIKPESPPGWPDRGTDVWATVERKAKSLDIPLSLRMIKKKLQSEELADCNNKGPSSSSPSSYCSIKAAFASMAFIVIELQSAALQMREAICAEDLDVITSKVQKEMHSSFVWLFQQVFSRTPMLMLDVMTLLADFSVYSASHVREIGAAPAGVITSSEFAKRAPQIDDQSSAHRYDGGNNNRLDDAAELKLWGSMVSDASKLISVGVEKYSISPVSVEIEGDNYDEYHRTDLIYQMNLSFEPGNSLLLCNYAQFLHLVAKDYDRAEECFKKAVQATPPDAEALSRYANFMWAVRRDLSGAEERFLQALALEPQNSYYASKYANFLWSTGGEETCFPASTEAQ